jgi:hypothetical protein
MELSLIEGLSSCQGLKLRGSAAAGQEKNRPLLRDLVARSQAAALLQDGSPKQNGGNKPAVFGSRFPKA